MGKGIRRKSFARNHAENAKLAHRLHRTFCFANPKSLFPLKIEGRMDGVVMFLRKISALAAPVNDRSLLGKARRYLFGNKWIWNEASNIYAPKNFKLYWETLDAVAAYQINQMTGNETLNVHKYILDSIRNYLPHGNLRGCFLGCLEAGGPEYSYMKSGLFEKIDVFDIAKDLIERKQEKIRQEGIAGINYFHANLNSHIFEPSAYDLVFSWGTIHHIENLEHLFKQIQQALAPGGILIVREYSGPNRLQFTDEQLILVNALLKCIPDTYRRRQDGSIKNREKRISESRCKRYDPSEAVRSGHVVSTIKDCFTFHSFRETGGALLSPLLNGIANNFEKDDRGKEILAALIEIEKILTKSKLLPSDYIFLIARPKQAMQPEDFSISEQDI